MNILNECSRFIKQHRRITIACSSILLAFVLLFSGIQINIIPSNSPIAQHSNSVIIGDAQIVFTIGSAEAATVTDYQCDGVNDNVEFQTALNALPNTGGKLEVLGGTYNFAATVTRVTDNVTIEGVGAATYFHYDGVNPVFTDGGNNWEYINLRTDNNGINHGANIGWVENNVIIGTAQYAFRTESGLLYNNSGNITDFVSANITSPVGRTATLVVAAYNASTYVKQQADYICDGTNDEVQLNAAWAALPASGGRIVLSEGTFNVKRVRITDKNNIWFIGQGFSTVVKTHVLTQPEADAGLGCNFSFENSSYSGVFNLLSDGDGASQTAFAAPGWWWYLGIETDANTYYFTCDNVYFQDHIGGGLYISSSRYFNIGKIYGLELGSTGAGVQQRSLLIIEGGSWINVDSLNDRYSRGGAFAVTGASAHISLGNVLSDDAAIQSGQIDGSSDIHINSLQMNLPTNGLVIQGTCNRITIDSFKIDSMTASHYPLEFYNGTMTDVTFNEIQIPSSVRGIYSHSGATEGILIRLKMNNALVSASGTEAYRFNGRVIDSHFVNCDSIKSAGDGWSFGNASNDNISFIGCDVRDAGDHYSGFYFGLGNRYRIVGCRSTDTAVANIQDYGIRIGNITNSIIEGNDFTGNAIASILIDAGYVPTTNKIKSNIGLITENSGVWQINTGTTSANVTHGLSIAPNLYDIKITLTSGSANATDFWVSGNTTTQFTINCDADPTTANVTGVWSKN